MRRRGLCDVVVGSAVLVCAVLGVLIGGGPVLPCLSAVRRCGTVESVRAVVKRAATASEPLRQGCRRQRMLFIGRPYCDGHHTRYSIVELIGNSFAEDSPCRLGDVETVGVSCGLILLQDTRQRPPVGSVCCRPAAVEGVEPPCRGQLPGKGGAASVRVRVTCARVPRGWGRSSPSGRLPGCG